MSELHEFAAHTAIVTGGSKGIGRAVAALLARRGAALVIVGRERAALEHTALELRHAYRAEVAIVSGDVADPATGVAALALALKKYGRIDVLANIAGAFPTALLEDTTDLQFADTLAANLTGTFCMCRAVLPQMKLAGGGAIVNMSSTAARFPTPGLAVYGASKAGIEALTRAVAAEAGPHVRVNAVSAGPTLTDSVRALMASDTTGAVAAVTRSLPLQRLAEPEEIAEAIVFLASRRASFITGQVLHANGGGIMV